MPDTFRLLAACCVPAGGAAATAADATLRAEAAAVLDWEAAIAEAARHGLLPIACRAWLDRGGDAVPESARVRLAAVRRESAARALAAARQLAALAATLEQAGVAALPFKGPALAVDAYGDIALRDFDDLDIIVEPRSAARAAAALGASGYAPVACTTWRDARHRHDWQGHVPFAGPGEVLSVELHWRFCNRKLPWSPSVADVLARATWIAVAGVRLRVPERHDQLLLVLLHAARHGWDRLEAIACAAALVARGIDGSVLLARAREAGGVRATLCGLELARRLTGIALPAIVTNAFAADGSLVQLADRAHARLRRGDAGDARDAALHLASLDGARDRMRYLALHVALPTPQDRAVITLPRALSPLYVAVRVARLARLAGRALLGSRFGGGVGVTR